jgi:hypothetical protein
MSVQLIVFPQSYNGVYNSTSYPLTIQYLVNGGLFTDLNSTSLYSYNGVQADVQQLAVINQPVSIPNTWYRYHTSGGSYYYNITQPQVVGGNVLFSGAYVTTPNHSGIYQKLSNLTVGVNYTITVDFGSSDAGDFQFNMYDDTGFAFKSQLWSPALGSMTENFTYTGGGATASFDWDGSALGKSCIVNSIKIIDTLNPQNLVFTDLADGQVICDLYEDEDIPLTLSVDDFKNVAEKVQSYSKAFKLPATKRNNQIFDNIFEVTRTDTGLNFNPYVKTQCILKQDGFLLFEGYLRLIDMSDKEGEISYNVNLYSEVVALKDILENKTFADISFGELELEYNRTNIQNSWNGSGTGPTFTFPNTSGFRDDNNTIKFPFVDWTHQYTVNPSTAYPVIPNLESTFRPFISIKYLIDRIFDEIPFTYESDFFNTSIATGGDFDFEKLYMDFNWSSGGDVNPNTLDTSGFALYTSGQPTILSTTSWVNVPVSQDDFSADFGYDDSTYRFTSPSGQSNANFDFSGYITTFSSAPSALQFRWLYTPSGGTPQPLAYQNQVATGSAIIQFTETNGVVTGTNIVEGGYYTSAPTLTIASSGINSGTGATFSVTMTGTAITGITITNGGTNYSDVFDTILINGLPQSIGQNDYYSGNLSQVMNAGDTLELQWKSTIAGRARLNTYPYPSGQDVGIATPVRIYVSLNIQGVLRNAIFQSLRGETGQWDFLKGIITMFNLISIPDKDNPNNILFEPYSNVFIHNTSSGTTSDLSLASRGIAYDWTDKIDITAIKLKPLTDLKKDTIFKFVEDEDDYPFMNYKNSVGGHLYGSKEFDATAFTVLTGEDEIVAEPFAATVPKPLMTQYPDLITPAIYSYNADAQTTEGFDNSPRIMYNNGIKTLSSCTYYIPAQNGGTAEDASTFLQFSHLSQVPSVSATTADFHFGECQYMPGLGSTAMNNLFNKYWSPYYYELYNADTRIMTLKVNLSPSDINSFNFFDTVMIKNREYRVNKIDYKPNDLATVEFILIP